MSIWTTRRVEWTFMPMTAQLSPTFGTDYPEIPHIFDNLHLMPDNISDILEVF